MDSKNLKCLLLGMLISVLLLFGYFIFFSMQQVMHNIQLKYTQQGLLVQFEEGK